MSRPRVHAPELIGTGGWLNTGGRPLSLAELRGKILILDFWTFCCINCLHVLDELRELEEKYADVLVVIGVHSPKFAHEAEHAAVVAAVERYDVRHPVLDDPELATWSRYTIRAWPTLVVVDPEGYIVAQLSGEGHGHGLDSLLAELVAAHQAKGTLRRGDNPFVPPSVPDSELRFPGKIIRWPLGDRGDDQRGRYLVSDSKHHSLVVLDAAGDVLTRIGTGQRGRADGPASAAQFSEPQGMCRLPAEVAAAAGYDVVIADTVNHLLRGLDSASGEVRTVAGTGIQWRPGSPTRGPALDVALSSPWDLAWFGDRLVIAMAGIHQLWSFDPRTNRVDVLAGTGHEGLRDGPAALAWLAQPSGLAVSADHRTLWIADSEVSALRRLEHGELLTAVGAGLFEFGHRDGSAGQALLQHPLGVCVLPDGSIAILDTYNGAVRRFDPASGEVSTLATGLAEPSDAIVDGDHLIVVESAAHRLTSVLLGAAGTSAAASAYRTQRPQTAVAPGGLRLEVPFEPPAGQKLDDRDGPPSRLVVSATPAALLVSGAGAGTELSRDLELAADVPEGVLHVAAMAASCDEGAQFAACHVHQQDWGVPVTVVAGGATELVLPLRGAG
ncbi:MAG TPA: NHL domain-containing thioredoxin family protein [Actinomycetes bacterium]|nr:NHL domain-containing thioredoxin family protein [Actinomycetes bacterium]